MGSQKIQGELWGKSPNGWAEVQEPQHKPLWEAMLDATAVGKNTTFLDVGCGAGGSSKLAIARGAEVHGIDVAEGLISIATQTIPNGSFKIADIENLPYKDNMFDVVYAANSLQYSENRISALHELRRVCRPNGRIIAGLFGHQEKVDYRIIFKALRDIMPEPPKGGGPFELSGPNKLESLFNEAGLTNIGSGEANCPFGYKDFETMWYGNVSAGPIQGMLQVVSENKIKSAFRDATKNFVLDDGRILIPQNIFKYVIAYI
jgi:SAM-dependent methyltransferase